MRSVGLLGGQSSVPVVVIDPSDAQPPAWMTIGGTNWTGAKAATEHLIALGHQRIGWIGGPQASSASTDRLHGYRAALQSAGIAIDQTIEANGEFTVEFGRSAASSLLASTLPPTAIVAADDGSHARAEGPGRGLAPTVHSPEATAQLGFAPREAPSRLPTPKGAQPTRPQRSGPALR